MKVFVATKKGQGKRKNDFSWTTDGELVAFAFECDGETVDGSCGCRRSMSGMDSRKATTTFMVEDNPITREKYIAKFETSEKDAGWNLPRETIIETADEMLRLANNFKVGDVIEKRGDTFRKRVIN